MTDEKNLNYIKSPKKVKLHYDQMKNTIDLLEGSGFAKEKIYPVIDIESDTDPKKTRYNICWSKKVSGVNEGNFLSINSATVFKTVVMLYSVSFFISEREMFDELYRIIFKMWFLL